jgi:hypothetical protein
MGPSRPITTAVSRPSQKVPGNSLLNTNGPFKAHANKHKLAKKLKICKGLSSPCRVRIKQGFASVPIVSGPFTNLAKPEFFIEFLGREIVFVHF